MTIQKIGSYPFFRTVIAAFTYLETTSLISYDVSFTGSLLCYLDNKYVFIQNIAFPLQIKISIF